jgi:hypothetical protein
MKNFHEIWYQWCALTLYWVLVTVCTTCFIKKALHLPTGRICVLNIILPINSQHFLKQQNQMICSHLTENTQFLLSKDQLMLFRKMIVVHSANHTEHINTLCGKNAEFFNVK